jgi:hypothetical protein
MPPNHTQKSRKSIEREGRILLAIEAIQKQEIRSLREAARRFNVPYATLRTRRDGTTNRAETRANGYKLTILEEESLLQWILSMDQRGAAPRPATVQEMANILLAKRCQQTIGKNWVYNFVKRHDEVKTRFSRRYNYERAKCEDPKVIQGWFDSVQRTIMEHGIALDDIYNFDETGFAMGLISTAKVVTRAEYYGRRSVLQPGNREWVTAIESIRANGDVLPSCVIFKGKTYRESWFDNLPNDWRFEVSENGWTTDEISLRWLQKLFIPATQGRTKGRYRLLVLDGHGSHLTPQFDRTCTENDIIPICMPAHSSHLLQPLDIGCFSVLKRSYGNLIEQRMRVGINHIDKLDFLTAFPQARAEAYKSTTIQSAFAAAGLVPYNPDRVISQLNIKLRTPTPPGSSSSAWSPKTPYNPKQLTRQASSIKRSIERRSRSPINSALNQLIKGCELAMHGAAVLTKENYDLRAANEKQKQKRQRSKKQLSYKDGISVQEARESINRQNQADEAVNSTQRTSEGITSQRAARAPPRCSDCRNIGHRRLQCPNRVNT